LLVAASAGNALYLQHAKAHFDFVALWSAGRALAQGLSPYDADATAAIQSPAGYSRDFYSPFYYPLWTALLFVPLGLLPLPWAATAWLTANQVMLLAALWSIARGMGWQPSLPLLGLTTLCCVVFHPLLVTFLDGQLAILVLLLLSVVYNLLHMEDRIATGLAAGALLALTMVKPQLALTIIPALLASLAVRRRWAGIAGFALLVAAMVGASRLLIPGWFGDWTRDRAHHVRSSRAVPSLWGVAYDLLPRYGLALAGMACVALLAWLVTLWWRHRQDDQAGLVLAITVIVGQLVSPYLWVYDQALLLFAFIVGMACLQARPGRTIWRAILCGWAVALPYLLYVWANLRGRATGNALLPLALAGVLLSMSWRQLYPPTGARRRDGIQKGWSGPAGGMPE
jgi:hypothetical protein